MSLSDSAFIAWLKSPERAACVLVEAVANVGGVETTFYLSNSGYTTRAADTPANQHYSGVINGGAAITEKLALNGQPSMAFGDIEIDNTDGSLDAWLGYVWHNRQTRMYVGDMRWDGIGSAYTRADFRLVFDGIADDLTSTRRDTLNLSVRDKLQRLNSAVTATTLGGATSNADKLLPLTFGEVCNVSPLLVDPATLKYQVHQSAIERIIEVRDNGVPVSSTNTLSAGTFVLTATPAGTVTVSVQGDKPGGVYSNTISKIVQRLATGYGANPFVSGDLDATNLAAFDSANPQPVGIWLDARENVLNLCQQLADSVGAQAVTNALGLLQLIQIALPAPGGVTPTAVSAIDMVEKTLEVASRPPVQGAQQLGYCKNWTVEANLQTGIPPAHKALFAQEWLTSTKSDATTIALYKLSGQPKPQKQHKPKGKASSGSATNAAANSNGPLIDPPTQADTYLLVKADADAEATRRLTLWKSQRTVYKYQGMPELMLEALGGYQTITHSRFGMSGGVTGQIMTVERDWINATVSFEVLV